VRARMAAGRSSWWRPAAPRRDSWSAPVESAPGRCPDVPSSTPSASRCTSRWNGARCSGSASSPRAETAIAAATIFRCCSGAGGSR
jgi:hypothetical protein